MSHSPEARWIARLLWFQAGMPRDTLDEFVDDAQQMLDQHALSHAFDGEPERQATKVGRSAA